MVINQSRLDYIIWSVAGSDPMFELHDQLLSQVKCVIHSQLSTLWKNYWHFLSFYLPAEWSLTMKAEPCKCKKVKKHKIKYIVINHNMITTCTIQCFHQASTFLTFCWHARQGDGCTLEYHSNKASLTVVKDPHDLSSQVRLYSVSTKIMIFGLVLWQSPLFTTTVEIVQPVCPALEK